MPYTYKLLVGAINDYMAAYEWYENKQEGLGNRFLKEVRLKMDAVTQYPEVYIVVKVKLVLEKQKCLTFRT